MPEILFEILVILLILFLLCVFVLYLMYRAFIKKHINKFKANKRMKQEKVERAAAQKIKDEKKKIYDIIPEESTESYQQEAKASKETFNSFAPYHLNSANVIYPCSSNTEQCIVPEHLHANDITKLYYELVESNRLETKFDDEVVNTILKDSKCSNLHLLSTSIENASKPIEIIISTLGEVLLKADVETIKYKKLSNDSQRFLFEHNLQDIVADIVSYDYKEIFEKVKHTIPPNILDSGTLYGEDRITLNNDKYFKKSNSIENKIITKLNEMSDDLKSYKQDANWGIDYEIKFHRYCGWMYLAFERFANDYNISQIITHPLLYKLEEEIKELIIPVSNEQLQALLNNFTLKDSFVEKGLKKASHFNFLPRADLTDEANNKLSLWYENNRQFYLKYIQISPEFKERIAMIIRNEMVRRDL